MNAMDDKSLSSDSTFSKEHGPEVHTHRSGSSKNSSSQDSTPSASPQEIEEFTIAKEEDRAVFRIRLVVACFLTVSTIVVATMVYIVTSRREADAFGVALLDFSSKVFENLCAELDQSLAAIDAFAVSAASSATAANMTWPFVVIPDVGTKLAKLRSVTKTAVATIVPMVTDDNLEEWNAFSIREGPKWVDDNLKVQAEDPGFTGVELDEYVVFPVYDYSNKPLNKSMYFPFWQSYPSASTKGAQFNFDISSISPIEETALKGIGQITGVANDPNVNDKTFGEWVKDFGEWDHVNEPASELHYPIFRNAAEKVVLSDGNSVQGEVVGFVWTTFFWRTVMTSSLPAAVKGLVVVIDNECNQAFTYQINGPDVEFLGFSDLHDQKYDHLEQSVTTIQELYAYASSFRTYTGLNVAFDHCSYTIHVYPSSTFEKLYKTSSPFRYTCVTVAIFAFTSIVFALYDISVERRQKKVLSTAARSSAIVSSLFPSNVRARLYDQNTEAPNSPYGPSQKNRLKSFVSGGLMSESEVEIPSKKRTGVSASNPIADLFLETTVMFGDISGFTAWSSTREPSNVFILLESLYGAFDALASKRGVFKVETIGDCYVAVAGLPDPCPNHAVVIAKFARDCYTQMKVLTSQLAVTLGPDTEELSMRFGLNSGPVTAGVLRGQKSRFQLFGDTMNTASRMESSGKKNCIHASQSTADELIKHNKAHWIHARKHPVEIKGKGLMATYWVDPRDNFSTPGSGEIVENEPVHTSAGEVPVTMAHAIMGRKIERLVDWNTDVLARLIRNIATTRSCKKASTTRLAMKHTDVSSLFIRGSPIKEVKEIITLPEFDPTQLKGRRAPVELSPRVLSQLREYVASIAESYDGSKNPFHNFEHASHVCLSVAKLMSRIITADSLMEEERARNSLEESMHERTFGISSDPLTPFACAFSALIHDAEHPGVPNAQVVKEDTYIARKYNYRSVAEQRSVDLGWNMFMEDRFTELRHVICPTSADLQRLRELVVNCVMATDIMDKDLKQLRNDRWEKAFDNSVDAMDIHSNSHRDSINRKATIVIEHLIQASDVSHTMQHWHIYRRWNERLFAEMYQAYQVGRAERNPAEFWYKGELGFFDFYIIPLAKKLSECGVFGVSSDECLNYALKNREEWERKGEQVIAEMLETLNASSS